MSKIMNRYRGFIWGSSKVNPNPQQELSRRERRKMARKGGGTEPLVQTLLTPDPQPQPILAPAQAPEAPRHTRLPYGYQSWPLKDLRVVAQQLGIRVNGKRPSLCNKAELLQAIAKEAP